MFGKLFGRGNKDVTESGLPAGNVTVSPVTATTTTTTTTATSPTAISVTPYAGATLDLGAMISAAREARKLHPNDPMAMATEIQQRLGLPAMTIPANYVETATAASPGPGVDVVGQLERLAKLHEAGALTDEEFTREKAKIIGAA